MAASRKAGGQRDFQHALIRMGQHIFPHPYPVGYKIIHRRLGQDLLKITAALAGADVCRPGNVFQADPARVFPVYVLQAAADPLISGIMDRRVRLLFHVKILKKYESCLLYKDLKLPQISFRAAAVAKIHLMDTFQSPCVPGTCAI